MGRYKSAPVVPGAERIFWIFGELRPRMDRTVLRFWNRENDEVYEILFTDAESALRHKDKLIDMNRALFEKAEGLYAAPEVESPLMKHHY